MVTFQKSVSTFFEGVQRLGLFNVYLTQVFHFKSLEELSLNRNKLTGEVPEDICDNRKNRLDPGNPNGVFENIWVDCSPAGNPQVTCPLIQQNPVIKCCTQCSFGKL